MEILLRLMQAQFDKMCATGKLYYTSVSSDKLWDAYYSAFPEKYNPIFRDPESATHNCNNCKNFIRHYGGIVAYDSDLNIMTIWDIDGDDEYINSITSIRNLIISNPVKTLFVETFETLNVAPYEKCTKNSTIFQLGMGTTFKQYTVDEVAKFGVVNSNDIYKFDHLHLFIPSSFIDKSGRSKGDIIGTFDSSYSVFKRGLDEINVETLELVIDLIRNNAILNGTTFIDKVSKFLKHKTNWLNIDINKRDIYALTNIDDSARFKNELIGVLCNDIQINGVEKACLDWNKRVDPLNYKRASAPISRQQIENAKTFVIDNGYEESFNRRCATLDDISAHEILHMNEGKISNVSVFDSISPTKVNNNYSFDNLPEIAISEFMENVLPNISNLELFVDNKLKNNFVTMTTSNDKDSKRMFAWDNNFSWTYNGNLSGKSAIKEAVKSAGGFVDAPFRFSIMWNEDGRSIVDFDAHCNTPLSEEIFYGRKLGRDNTMLDIDMIRPSRTGIENIFNKDLNNLVDGVYKFTIHNYDGGNNTGVKAEIVFGDEIFTYEINENLKGAKVIAFITVKDSKLVKINHNVTPSTVISSEIYSLKTNEFHNVNLVCKSPNHWDDNKVGNLHYFFMLENCKNGDEISTFHTENLNSELTAHRKVIQLLTNTTKIKCDDNQLSGVGFNSTMGESVIVKGKIKNKTNIYKIKI